MKNTIQKFIDYLNGQRQSILASRIIQNKTNCTNKILGLSKNDLAMMNFIQDTIDCLRIEKEKWSSCDQIYDNFLALSKYLIFSPLSNQEQLQIILYLIEKNLAIPFLNDELTIEVSNESTKIETKMQYTEEAAHAIQELELPEELLSSTIQLLDFINSHKTIQEHYMQKKNTYTLEDIKLVIKALLDLHIDKTLCDVLEVLLEKRLKKRNITPTQSNPKPKEIKKSYKELREEIAQYYDSYQGIFLAPMTEEDVFELAKKLIAIGSTEKQMEDFYLAVNTKLSFPPISPLQQFEKLYPKIEYYCNNAISFKGKFDLQLLKEEICFEADALISCSKENFPLYEKELEEDLKKAELLIGWRYEYEYETLRQSFTKTKS